MRKDIQEYIHDIETIREMLSNFTKTANQNENIDEDIKEIISTLSYIQNEKGTLGNRRYSLRKEYKEGNLSMVAMEAIGKYM